MDPNITPQYPTPHDSMNQPQPSAAPPAPQAAVKEFMQRRVTLPMWALVTSSLIGLCLLCSLCSTLGRGVGAAETTSSNSSSSGNQAATAHGPTATAGPTATPTQTPTPTHAPQWTTVNTYTGNGTSKTATFTVNADQWKIIWSCNPAAYGFEYNLMADLKHPGDDFGDTVVNVICKSGDASSTHGETMEYTGGTFYLDVNSEASWKFEVQILK